ncbi:PREDICTED: LOW QUALITY PROTEIN: solute carrier family 22 member 6-like [Ficedula albicollis]|uniref:LOW QUALITY PROTEIN: solute carrier family 22 member 6-like n=1 Tax=Ficedula albicollis TaxID=59894 RepID=UPI0007AD80F5|nr:PREDICTED: LOW QUALITY PROTEIN: solute carrier family 22 member 6-like [Ficedula albicollis]
MPRSHLRVTWRPSLRCHLSIGHSPTSPATTGVLGLGRGPGPQSHAAPCPWQWDLVCSSRGLKQLAQSLYMAGVLAGGVFGGLSPRFGRRSVLTWCYLQMAAMGTCSSFAPTFTVYCLFRFLTGMAFSGIVLNSVSLCTSARGRDPPGACRGGLCPPPWVHVTPKPTLGTCLGGLCVPPWVHVTPKPPWAPAWVGSVPPHGSMSPQNPPWAPAWVGSVSSLWVRDPPEPSHVPRGDTCGHHPGGLPVPWAPPRWAPRPLAPVGPGPARTCPGLRVPLGTTPVVSHPPGYHPSTGDIFTPCPPSSWPRFSTSFAYYGLAMDLQNFEFDIYVIQLIFGAVDIPAKLVSVLTITYVGRRFTQALALVLAGLAILANTLVPRDLRTLRTALAVFGKGCLAASFNCVFLYTGELYPTVIR